MQPGNDWALQGRSEVGVDEVFARRRAEQETLISRARHFAEGLDAGLGVQAVVVVGSVARGDFNRWSDVDVVVIAEGVGGSLLERLEQLGPRPGRIEPSVWLPEEGRARLARADPMAVEAIERGIWLVGSPSALGA